MPLLDPAKCIKATANKLASVLIEDRHGVAVVLGYSHSMAVMLGPRPTVLYWAQAALN